jgi:murein DD-endopeptidase MepM/ murein hydrolase activator NlpD
MPLRFAFWILLWLSALPGLVCGRALGDDLPSAVVDEYFLYPLRGGESLSDVARTFHVSVQDLTSVNHLGDVDNLQIGQTIRVPNGFAHETAALRAEQSRVLEEKRRVERESAERQRALADLQARQRQLEAERNAFAAELATLASWRVTAKIALGLFLLALAWALKSRIERARTARRHAAMVAHNAALSAAKERYRQAAAQLELRYQKLYGGLAEPVSGTVRDGVDRIRAAFGEGSAEIERQLVRLAGARAADRESVHAEEKGRAWIPHPVRELLERNRLKYHTP